MSDAGFCTQLAAHPRADGRRNLSASLATPTPREVESSVLIEDLDLDGKVVTESIPQRKGSLCPVN